MLARYLPLVWVSVAIPASAQMTKELLTWMDLADKRLDEGYRGASIPTLKEGFAEARRKLLALGRR